MPSPQEFLCAAKQHCDFLDVDAKRSLADKLDEDALQSGLSRWRDHGDLTARKVLIDGLRWIAYDSARHFRFRGSSQKDWFNEAVGEMTVGLCEAIDQLANNIVEDIEDFVRKAVERSNLDYRRELWSSRYILVPTSTKSSRKKKGYAPYTPLKLTEDISHATEDGKHSLDRDYAPEYELGDSYIGPSTDQSGKECIVPSKYMNQSAELKIKDAKNAMAKNDLERRVVDLFEEGFERKEICEKLDISMYALRQIVDVFKQRAQENDFIESEDSICSAQFCKVGETEENMVLKTAPPEQCQYGSSLTLAT